MNPRRLLVALLAALLLSGAVTYFLTRRINGRVAATPVQTTQKYVAASRSLQPGEVLKAGKPNVGGMAGENAPRRRIHRIEELSGRAVIYPVVAGNPSSRGIWRWWARASV